MSCPNDFYSSQFNKMYQDMYSAQAQAADTDLSKVVTSGWSLDRLIPPTPVSEGYMTPKSAGGYQPLQRTKYVVPSSSGNKVVENYEGGCGTPTVVASPMPGSSTEYYGASPSALPNPPAPLVPPRKAPVVQPPPSNKTRRSVNTLLAAPLLPGTLVEGYGCPTDYLNTNYNKAYQGLYSR